MPDKTSKGQVIRLSISMRLGTCEQLDDLGETLKEHTGVHTGRSKLITMLAKVAHEAKADIDYSQVRDEATLQQELAHAIARRFQREPEPKP